MTPKQQLHEDGFVIVRGVISPDELALNLVWLLTMAWSTMPNLPARWR